jgi:hypothetical protein
MMIPILFEQVPAAIQHPHVEIKGETDEMAVNDIVPKQRG